MDASTAQTSEHGTLLKPDINIRFYYIEFPGWWGCSHQKNLAQAAFEAPAGDVLIDKSKSKIPKTFREERLNEYVQ